ncbi:thioredoxin family protein [Mongoliitalea lutea]|uniref:Thioredoxin n=1 Tax=Mongoliitalea lutea TaxID=849756 RepID=A0A8J3D0U2_9BACT|nr:thioredoxin fold domain-containing protein [Mongoliitalea lutea]GHB53695.1 thioredoxin [Mongoliitalea lutea]
MHEITLMNTLKNSLCILLFLFSSVSAAFAQDQIHWLTFEEAVVKTGQQPKMVFVDVYTDWCGWCKKMDKETFTDPAVVAYINSNFYAVKLNAEKTDREIKFKGQTYTEASIARAMRVSSYPNFIIMDASMENITQYPGYRKPEPFLEGLTGILDRFMK